MCAHAAGQRGQQPVLAFEAMCDVLVELRGRVPHDRPVPGTQRVHVERAQPTQRLHVEGERVSARRDEDAALAQHRVAAEHDAAGDERDVVERVPRRGDHSERPERVAVARARHPGARLRHRGLLEPSRPRRRRPAATGAPNRSRSSGTASAWSRCACVSAMPATPPRRSASATTRATCPGSAGPGSITQAGSPTIHVFVPDSVSGPAFGARTSATPSGTRSVTAATGPVLARR